VLGFQVELSSLLDLTKEDKIVHFNETYEGVLDSGTSVLLVPPEIYDELMASIMINKEYTELFGVYFSTCDSLAYPSLYVELTGGLFFEVPPSAYLE
jgi:hypothetical protein